MSTPRRPALPPTLWVTAEKLTQQVLWVVLFVVLGPLLGPRPYGVFALAMVAYGWLEAVMTESMAEALLLVPEPGPHHYAVANLANVTVAVAASFFIVLAGFPLSVLIHEPQFPAVMMALAPLPILGALMAGPIAYLKRKMQFRQFALRSMLGLAIGCAFGIVCALRGAGVWSLVAQILAQRVAETLILWSACGPIFQFRWNAGLFRELRACAASIALARSWTWLSGLAPRVIIAAVLGPSALGLYSIASRIGDLICQVVLSPASQVAHLKLMQLTGDRAALSKAFEDLVARLALVAFPVAIGLAAVSHVLFQDWLGTKWAGADVATVWVVLAVLPWTIFYAATALFLGLRIYRLDQRIQLGLAVSAVIATVVAAPYGLNAACAALFFRLLILMIVPVVFFKIYAGINLRRLWRAVVGPLVAASAMGVCVALASPVLTVHLGGEMALPVLVVFGAILYAGGIWVLSPGHLRSFLADLGAVLPQNLREAAR